MSKGYIPFFLLAFLISGQLKAQVSPAIPDYFDQYFNNYYLLNPANTDTTYKYKAALDNKAQTGLFKGVNKIYFDGDLKLNSENKVVYHFIGVQVINNREGEFISRSRLYGRYSIRTRISSRASLSTGISLGLVNYSFKTSQAGSGGSDAAPDGNIGIWYLRETFTLGFSAQQLLNGKLTPINQEYELSKYYNFNLTKTFVIHPYINVHTHLYSRFQKNQSSNTSLACIFDIKEKLETGVNYRQKKGLVFVAGLKQINIGTSTCALYFSYLSDTKKISAGDNAFEFYVSIQR